MADRWREWRSAFCSGVRGTSCSRDAQPGGKGFSEKVLVRIDPVALTGFQDPVDGGIRGTQARIGLLVFKFQDLGVISIGLGQKGQVVLHVL